VGLVTAAKAVILETAVESREPLARTMSSIHNYFFYFKEEMPWKTNEIQDKKEKRSREAGEEVEGSKEVSVEERGDKPSARTGSD